MINNFLKNQITGRRSSSMKISGNHGFTLIEIMVSVSIFTVIITTGIGALVSIVNTYEVTQKQKKVHDGLNYALESMTREIRLGRNYYSNPDLSNGSQGQVNNSNPGSESSIGFDAAEGPTYIMYYLDNGVLMVSKNGERNALTNDNEVVVEDLRFRVSGTQPGSTGDNIQPSVWIQIKAVTQGGDRETVVQSFVSQRSLDV